MIVDAISDLHGYYPKLDGGDLLIVCGDYTASDKLTQWAEFFVWLKKQNYRKKILIAGNHDRFMESCFPKTQEEADDFREVQDFLGEEIDFEYLCNSGTEFTYEEDDIELERCGIHPTVEKTIKIWGTPHSLIFDGVNPRCTAFMGIENDLKEKYDLIPEGIDILISHTPPFGILDRSISGQLCGSVSLREAMFRVKPKYLVFGHIHECGGKDVDLETTRVINCSYVNERYKPVNKLMRITI